MEFGVTVVEIYKKTDRVSANLLSGMHFTVKPYHIDLDEHDPLQSLFGTFARIIISFRVKCVFKFTSRGVFKAE